MENTSQPRTATVLVFVSALFLFLDSARRFFAQFSGGYPGAYGEDAEKIIVGIRLLIAVLFAVFMYMVIKGKNIQITKWGALIFNGCCGLCNDYRIFINKKLIIKQRSVRWIITKVPKRSLIY